MVRLICSYTEEEKKIIRISKSILNVTFMHIHTLIFVIGVAFGIVTGYVSPYGSEAAIASLFIFLTQLGIYFFSIRNRSKNETIKIKSSSHILLCTLIVTFAFFVGVVRMQFVESPLRFVCDNVCSFTGRVVTQPEIKNIYQVFDVQVIEENSSVQNNKNKVTANVRVRVPLYPGYRVGEEFIFTGKVMPPPSIFSHAGTKTFDYNSYLRINNVGSEMYYPKVVIHTIETKKTFVEKLMSHKQSLLQIIKMYVNSPASALAGGMLLGDSQMSKELIQTFRVSGLSHIVVLSGFNIAILITALLLLLKVVPIIIRVILVALFVTMFVIMVGGEASVLRATLMAFVSLLALLVGRAYVAYQALLISLLLIILYSPLSLVYDVSLHLSFLATAGIVYMNDGIKMFIPKYIPKGCQDIISTTLSAYFATLPYVMYTFGTASIYAIVANLLVLVFVPLVMLLTVGVVFMSFISSTLTYPFGYVTTLFSDYIIWVARLVEVLPYASLSVTISYGSMVCMYVILIGIYFFLTTYKKDETRVTKNDEIILDIISY